jgi:hypothetical protein
MLPAPVSDYDSFFLADITTTECPDCGALSPETDELSRLLAWIDGHLPVCPGWGPDARDEEQA